MAASRAFEPASIFPLDNTELGRQDMATPLADALSDDASDDGSTIAVSQSGCVLVCFAFFRAKNRLSPPLLAAASYCTRAIIDDTFFVQMIMDGTSNAAANQHIRFGPMLLKPTKKLVSRGKSAFGRCMPRVI